MRPCGAEKESNKKLQNLLLYGSEDFELERHEKLIVVIQQPNLNSLKTHFLLVHFDEIKS